MTEWLWGFIAGFLVSLFIRFEYRKGWREDDVSEWRVFRVRSVFRKRGG